MSGPPPWTEMPTWLQLLHTAKHNAGNPEYQEIAEASGLNKSTIGDIFNNVIRRPRQSTLAKIFEALHVSDEMAKVIRTELFVPEMAAAMKVQPAFEPLEFRTDTQILADAINNLADAIRHHGGDRSTGPSLSADPPR